MDQPGEHQLGGAAEGRDRHRIDDAEAAAANGLGRLSARVAANAPKVKFETPSRTVKPATRASSERAAVIQAKTG